MNRTALIEQLSQDIFGYLLEGQLTTDAVAEVIRPESLDTRFEDFERLANLHFILREPVEEFVEDLDYRLRNIRTSTKQQSNVFRGGIEGHIDWPSTFQYRYSKEPGNTAVYVCDTREEQYNIPENIVLKALLEIVDDALDDLSELLNEDRNWVTKRWPGDSDAVEEFQRTLERNIHLREMRDVQAHEPTERMLTTATNARDQLYRDAADLVEFHQDLQRGTPATMQELLSESMVTPEDEDTLFELFSLFRVITTLERLTGYTQPTINSLGTGRDAVAEFAGPIDLAVFYDQSGQQEGLSFLPTPDETDVEKASRGDAVQIAAAEIAESYFDTSFQKHTKRPDVLVVPTQSVDQTTLPYLVIEVKNSTTTETIRDGIRELLEYLAFMRREGDFVFPTEDKFGQTLNGLLVVQDFGLEDPEVRSVHRQYDLPIRIAQASELEGCLNQLIPKIFTQ